ncbi:MAG: tRNA (guanosine(46)-N7)-methyltransferase TrmB [Oligoflexia bacterium]|nr:tRNA (guanosine(46)-N7)-methyltransferase TrmB [Oligoflexia bacterium]
MSQLKMSLTRNIPFPNIYVQMLPEYKGWIFVDEEAASQRGEWRQIFSNPSLPLDLEIGCGNGTFFDYQARKEPNRNLLGIELKYKPLVQTVRRVRKDLLPNAKGIRFQARQIELLFGENELDNVFIFFPDPWPRKKQQKNRLMKLDFFEKLYRIQKPGSIVTIKTDDLPYFEFAVEEIKKSPYKILRESRDLHQSPWADENFVTAFERIFIKQGVRINYVQLLKPQSHQ